MIIDEYSGKSEMGLHESMNKTGFNLITVFQFLPFDLNNMCKTSEIYYGL